MNAPISAALLQLRTAAPVAPLAQPMIPATLRLLRAGYEHDGLRIDLYGTLDEAGYDVQCAALAAATELVDLAAWLTPEQLRQMSDWCDRHLPSAHELSLVSQQEAQAERAQWERGFRSG